MLRSPHRDVLEATADTVEQKEKLVEELKNRGRGCVASKDWKNAEMLYEKAITLHPEEAPLHSNLSLVKFSMGQWKESKEAAEKAVKSDESYLKGYWRLGQSLVKMGCNKEALDINQKALDIDPKNKAFKKEIEKLQKKIELEGEKVDMEPKKDQPKTEPAEPLSVMNKPKPAKKPAAESKVVETASNEFTKSDHVKGYKIVNGKKTSYFHNELDEKTKQLIGDIAPKRLDAAPAPQQEEKKEAGTSAWNKAGTWEEKDVTAWAKPSLEKALMMSAFVLPDSSPAPGASVLVTSVKKCDGHASCATVRGKKRYIYEFILQVKWEFLHADNKASGTMTFPDFDGTVEIGEGYEMVDWTVSESTSGSLTPLLERFVKNGGLRDSLHQTLDEWVGLFRATY